MRCSSGTRSARRKQAIAVTRTLPGRDSAPASYRLRSWANDQRRPQVGPYGPIRAGVRLAQWKPLSRLAARLGATAPSAGWVCPEERL
jgi:hypothetical protein